MSVETKIGFVIPLRGKSYGSEIGRCPALRSASLYKELDGKFVSFLSSKDADKIWVMEGGVVPGRESLVTDIVIYALCPDASSPYG